MGPKHSSTAVPKISSAASPSVSSATTSSQKSSILKSAFAPSQFQLHLFASVIQSFDSQQLRIHDTSSGRLRCQHDTKPGARITSLDWGYYGPDFHDQRQGSDKRKRKRDNAASESAVVAYATSTSEIYFFSPAEAKVVGTLVHGHDRGVRDFKFTPGEYKQGWSIGEDSVLVQWDLVKGQPIRSINLPDPAISILAVPSTQSPEILCASSSPFAIHLTASENIQIDRFDAFKNPIHTLFRSGLSDSEASPYFLAADNEKFLNIYDITQKSLVKTLVAGSGVVEAHFSDAPVSSYGQGQMVAAITKAGVVELFSDPFAPTTTAIGESRSSRQNLTKKASASVRLISADTKSTGVTITAASLQGPDLVIVSAVSGVDLCFQKVRWQDEGNGELLFDGVKEVVRTKSASTLNTATLNGVKDMGKAHVDDSKTIVVNGGAAPESDAVEILSSDSEAEDSADEDNENIENVDPNSNEEDPEAGSDEEMEEANDNTANQDQDLAMVDAAPEVLEPSFGEMLSSKHPETITIIDAFGTDASALAVKPGLPRIPSGMSLGTVLTQSLRTNDNNLLEACLHTLDINIVKNTIQRLDSSLAGILLSKLAERLSSRPGRYGHLITWVQWTCIAHGGAIAAQPDVNAKVRTLYNVLTQRTQTLDSLLLLKGKLDMLDAQLAFRKQLAAQRPATRDDQDEPGVIYIEGKDTWDSSDSEDLDEDISRPLKKRVQGRGSAKATRRALEDLIDDDDEESDDEDPSPLLNGNVDSDDDDSDDDESEDDDEDDLAVNGGKRSLIDNEAEVSGAEDSDPDDQGDSLGEDSSSKDGSSSDDDDDDVDEEEEESDSEMDDFINDGEISFAEDEDDVHISGDDDDEEGVDVGRSPEPKASVSKQKKSSKKTSSMRK
ncbi:hypothetical protein PV10_01510 [Exophiala mesophila]|uniref:Small-subunit processome Utp12 domain-containing protein n=1 Tax=Exophiala mesophila TaxID=212818 RepID=A0A0D2AFV7_EXOME|nr:uncharacterized protein PV10_01510 [Exophiala mesophila]KIV97803.1 hypothetical protein PV10_01510 [Exophiala mesophila]